VRLLRSVFKNDTFIENLKDVDAILELCRVLIHPRVRRGDDKLGTQAHNYANRDPRQNHTVGQDELARDQD